jgi:hypothetical protein
MQIEALETVFAQLLGANPIVGNLLLLRNVYSEGLDVIFSLGNVVNDVEILPTEYKLFSDLIAIITSGWQAKWVGVCWSLLSSKSLKW